MVNLMTMQSWKFTFLTYWLHYVFTNCEEEKNGFPEKANKNKVLVLIAVLTRSC